MKSNDLTNSPLFEPMLDLKIDEGELDLHNNYDCQKIEKSADEQKIVFYFKSASGNGKNKLILEFDNAHITKSKYPINDTTKAITLNNFHRGKFLTPEKTLSERNELGQNYYYVSFAEGQETEIFAERIVFSLM